MEIREPFTVGPPLAKPAVASQAPPAGKN
jgi:hypothetical protein